MFSNFELIITILFIVAAVVICILKLGKKAFPYLLFPVLMILINYWFFACIPALFYILIFFNMLSLIFKRKHVEYK